MDNPDLRAQGRAVCVCGCGGMLMNPQFWKSRVVALDNAGHGTVTQKNLPGV